MTGDVFLLSNVRSIIPCPVSFADGSHVMATKSGSLRLSVKLTLQNVLFVPNLNCTLLSVAKLLRQT
uniref:Retrovirus-related Pol polyprotein from transposon TNT 1-94-like beta-barrel domain-containing protein n=1 Tax=Brassica oleracea var. oleracea TaxID=109376 RepID=A0A0D3AGG1_BRAOL